MNYSIKNYDEKTMAKAKLSDVGISLKVTVEIFNMIRYKNLAKAKIMLQDVISHKKAVPYKRFNKDVGHKRSIGPGRYPEKASDLILSLLNLVESNASNKGLSDELEIIHLVANKGAGAWHYGRQRRRKMKKSHIEIVVKEKEGSLKKTVKKETKMPEVKEPEVKTEQKIVSSQDKKETKQKTETKLKKSQLKKEKVEAKTE